MAQDSQVSPKPVHTRHTFQAFHNRSYRLLWPANFSSYISRWMQMTTLSWLVLELTDSPFKVALVGFFGMAPMLLLGAFGGVLADRVNRHRLLVTTMTVNFLAALAVLILLQTDAVRVWHVYLSILVTGTGWALDMPSRRSVMHDLLGRSGVTNAIALDSVGMHSSKMLGPALGGALIALVNVSGAYIVVTAFYAVAVILIWSVRLPQGGDRTRERQNVLRNLAEGFRYVRGHDAIRATVLITVLMNLLLFPYMQMVPVVARDVLNVGPGLMGVLMGADGMGALAGAVLIASAGSISYHGRVYVGGSMLALIAVLLFSLSRWYFVSLPILVVLGLGTAGFGTMQATIVMLLAKEEMRGRALGIISLAIGAGPLGALMIGAIASAVNPTFAIGLNAVLGIVSLALVAALMPSLRQRTAPDEQDTVPEAQPVTQRLA